MKLTKSSGAQHQHRVLCVDDDELSLLLNATILRNEGYQVVACSDPVRAASIAKSEELDLVIVDYQMPRMNGAELAALCKAANPDIRVILFSGSVTIPSSEVVLADCLVQKADGIEALLDTLECLLMGDKASAECCSAERRSYAEMD